MKLVTFQTRQALTVLERQGVLAVSPDHINLQRYGIPYDYMVQQMKTHRIFPPANISYPLWAWAKYGVYMAPKKRKNLTGQTQDRVKITFEKSAQEVLLSDYMAYSFMLSGHIVPKTHQEYYDFLNEMVKRNIPLEELKNYVRHQSTRQDVVKLFPKIQKTWKRIFDLKSNVHQACVWDIKLSEVLEVDLLEDANYRYGVVNALRANGTRPNWKKKYLKFLPD